MEVLKLRDQKFTTEKSSHFRTRYFHRNLRGYLDNYLSSLPDGTSVDIGGCRFGPSVVSLITSKHLGRLNFFDSLDETYNKALKVNNEAKRSAEQFNLYPIKISFNTFDEFINYISKIEGYCKENQDVGVIIEESINPKSNIIGTLTVASLVLLCKYVKIHLSPEQLYYLTLYLNTLGYKEFTKDNFEGEEYILFKKGNMRYFEEIKVDSEGMVETQYRQRCSIKYYFTSTDFFLISKKVFNGNVMEAFDNDDDYKMVLNHLISLLHDYFKTKEELMRGFFDEFNQEHILNQSS